MTDGEVRIALRQTALLGETPVWNDVEQRLYWIDSIAAKVHRFDPDTGVNETLQAQLEGYLGSIALGADGGLLALCGKRLLKLAPGSWRAKTVVAVEADLPDNTPNDGKVDPQGRFWFGTMHATVGHPTGGLYSYDPKQGLRRHDGGFACANGMAWSPDGGTFYFVDMMPGHILAYDFDGRAGAIGNRRVFVAIDPSEGMPDGICADAEGSIWVAHWDGGCVSRYDAKGRRTDKIEVAVPRPTCPIFGGPGLRTLFVTSSADGVADKAPLSGSIFSWEPRVPGIPIARYAD